MTSPRDEATTARTVANAVTLSGALASLAFVAGAPVWLAAVGQAADVADGALARRLGVASAQMARYWTRVRPSRHGGGVRRVQASAPSADAALATDRLTCIRVAAREYRQHKSWQTGWPARSR